MSLAILLVDNDRLLLTMLGDLLALADYRVYSAATVQEAVAVLARQQVDLIISDSMRPTWDPQLPVVQQLRAAARSTPIVLFTAWNGVDAAVAGGQANLAAVWRKPLDFDQLLDSVRRILGESTSPGAASA